MAESVAAVPEIHPEVVKSAKVFWLIAGLSLVNAVLLHSGTNVQFVVGLGMTTLAGVLFAGNLAVAFAVEAVLIGFYVLMGVQAGKARTWAFVLGMVVYALDAVIFLLAKDWLPVALHALFLYYLFKGLREI